MINLLRCRFFTGSSSITCKSSGRFNWAQSFDRGWKILMNFGPLFRGAQIFDCRYLGHFLSDRHKILHGYGSSNEHFFPILVNFDSWVLYARLCYAFLVKTKIWIVWFALFYQCDDAKVSYFLCSLYDNLQQLSGSRRQICTAYTRWLINRRTWSCSFLIIPFHSPLTSEPYLPSSTGVVMKFKPSMSGSLCISSSMSSM